MIVFINLLVEMFPPLSGIPALALVMVCGFTEKLIYFSFHSQEL